MRHPVVSILIAATLLAGCEASPLSTTTTPTPAPTTAAAHAETRSGDFLFTFDLPKTTSAAGEPITGEATLAYEGQGSTSVMTYGGGPISFWLTEVAGTRSDSPILTTDCVSMPMFAGSPIKADLHKGGGPNQLFIETVPNDPGYRLPAGDWDLRAEAWFTLIGCTMDPPLALRIPIRVTS